MGDFNRGFEAGKRPPGDRGSVNSGQLGDSSGGRKVNGANPHE
jgi:hypothetical protein